MTMRKDQISLTRYKKLLPATNTLYAGKTIADALRKEYLNKNALKGESRLREAIANVIGMLKDFITSNRNQKLDIIPPTNKLFEGKTISKPLRKGQSYKKEKGPKRGKNMLKVAIATAMRKKLITSQHNKKLLLQKTANTIFSGNTIAKALRKGQLSLKRELRPRREAEMRYLKEPTAKGMGQDLITSNRYKKLILDIPTTNIRFADKNIANGLRKEQELGHKRGRSMLKEAIATAMRKKLITSQHNKRLLLQKTANTMFYGNAISKALRKGQLSLNRELRPRREADLGKFIVNAIFKAMRKELKTKNAKQSKDFMLKHIPFSFTFAK